jgi:hypothetical protein
MTAFNEATLVSDVETPISKSGKGDLTRLVDPGGTLVARVSLGKMPDPKLPPKLPGGPPEPFQPIVVCIDQVKWSTQ